jgi:uncharacterized protein (DUF362 family)
MPILIQKENDNVRAAVRLIFRHFNKNLDPSKGYFLKPNIVFPVSPKSGEITRPDVVRSVIDVIRETDTKADIVIAEGTAAGTNPQENFHVSGYSKLADEMGVRLFDLNEVEKVTHRWKYGNIELPKMVFERNYISLPILKLSSAAVISGALKNQKGILSPSMKKNFHKLGLHDPIAQLAKIIQPALTILDGINFFRTNNILIAGDNAFEIDGMAIRLLNIEEPDYFKIAREMGVGRDDFSVFGDEVVPIPAGTYGVYPFKESFNIRLWSNPRACSACRLNFYNIKNRPLKDPKYTLRMSLKLLKYMMTGADFVFGSKVQFSPKSRNVVCMGNCTKKLAEDNNYIHVPGCPPTEEDMINYL